MGLCSQSTFRLQEKVEMQYFHPDMPENEARELYRQYAHHYHPDTNPGNEAQAAEMFFEVKQEYEEYKIIRKHLPESQYIDVPPENNLMEITRKLVNTGNEFLGILNFIQKEGKPIMDFLSNLYSNEEEKEES